MTSSLRVLAAGMLALIALSGIHLCIGARPVSATTVVTAFVSYDPSNYLHVIVVKQRLTRLVVALAIGAVLAVAGYALQKVLRNDLVSSSTLGVDAGAAAFSVIAVYAFGFGGLSLFWPALVGAVLALAVTFLAADLLGRGSRDPLNLVLGGVMCATLFSTVTGFVLSLDPDAFENILGWLVGDIGIFDYEPLLRLWPIGLVALAAIFLLARPLDVMSLGGEQAETLGVDMRWIARLLIGGSIVLSVIAVTTVGPIGFIGLVAPHMARLLAGETGATPLAACMLLGAMMLVAADILARTIVAPQLLNVGTVAALFGGMAFLAIILSTLRRRAI